MAIKKNARTSRKGETLIASNRVSATSAATTPSNPIPVSILAPSSDDQSKETRIKAVEPAKVITVSTALDTFTKELSPSETREAREATEFVFTQVSAAANNLLAVGTRMIELKASWGVSKFNRFVREVLAKAHLMSENNINLWMGRAKVIAEKFPNPTVRKFMVSLSNGQNIVTRHEPNDEDKKAGSTGYYDLSPFVQQAIEKITAPKGKLNDEAAEMYARNIIETSSKLRSAARVPDEAKDIAMWKANTVKRFSAGMKKFGAPQASNVLYSLFVAYVKTAKYEDAEKLVGKLDTLLNTAHTLNGVEAQNEVDARKPGTKAAAATK